MAFRLRPRSIQGELAILVAVLALPLLGLIAYSAYEQFQDEVSDAQATVRVQAEIAADRAQRYVEDVRLTLEALARRAPVRAMDPARCDPGLRDLPDLYPRASNFLVVDRGGRIICGAIPPPPGRVALFQAPEALRAALQSGLFTLSPPMSDGPRRWHLDAIQPVLGSDGAVTGAVSVSIDLLGWRPFPGPAGMPEMSIVTLLSGPYVIATSGDAADWIGRDIRGSEVFQRVQELGKGSLRARGAAGVDRIWAFRPVPGTPWTALSGIDAQQVLAPARARMLRTAALVAGVVVMVTALAFYFGRWISRPILNIAEAVRRRRQGQADVPIPVAGPREIAAVGEELNRSSIARDEAERTLRASEERFRALWENSADAILIVDQHSVIRYANPAVLGMFGHRPEELAGQDLAGLQPRHLAAAHRDGMARYLRTGERHIDWRAVLTAGRHRDGREFPLEVSFSELYLDGRRYFAGFLRDVSEREHAEQRLRIQQQLFAALSEVNEAIVRERERMALFEAVCRICAERIGFVVAFVSLIEEGRAVPKVRAGPGADGLDKVSFPLDAMLPLGSSVTATAVRTRRAAVANEVDADPAREAARPLRERVGSRATAAFPLFEGGEVIGALSVHAAAAQFFDAQIIELLQRMADDLSFALDKMAERDKLDALTRELEERVRRRTAELEAANQELEAFSYSVSHDLRAPVRHVAGFMGLLEKELPRAGAKAKHYMATIAAAAKRMDVLIDDLLTLSRTGRQPLNLKRVELGPMVQELVREAQPEIARRKVEWSVGELPAVLADASLLRVVLQNLLSNALKYTRPQPVARIVISAQPLDGAVIGISVRDNGVGFDPDLKDRLFAVFQRLHGAEEFEGSGIGLATARRIVHRHGQRIWGDGAPGTGAVFTFTMAAAEGMHASGADVVNRE